MANITKEELFNNLSEEIRAELQTFIQQSGFTPEMVNASFYRTFINSSYTEASTLDDKCWVVLRILYKQYGLQKIEKQEKKTTIQAEKPLFRLDEEGLKGLPNYNYIRLFMDYIVTPRIYPEIAYQNGLASLSALVLKRAFSYTEGIDDETFKDPLYCNTYLLVFALTAAGKTIPLKAAMNIIIEIMGEGVFTIDTGSPEALKEILADEIIGGEKEKKKSKKEEEPEEFEEESETQELTDEKITVSISYEKPVVVKAPKETKDSKKDKEGATEPETPKEDASQPETPKVVPEVISLTTRYNPFTKKWVTQPTINDKKQPTIQHKKPISERETGRDRELKTIISATLDGVKTKDAEVAVNKLQVEAVKKESDLIAMKKAGENKAKEQPADIAKYPKSWKVMWDDEIGGFFAGTQKQFMLGMIELICKLYSCMSVSKGNAGGNSGNATVYNVRDPCFSINGATVSDDLVTVLSVSMIVRGLLPRFLILNPDYKIELPKDKEEDEDDKIDNIFDDVENSATVAANKRDQEKREALVKAGQIIDTILGIDQIEINFHKKTFDIIKNWEIRALRHYQDEPFILKMRSRCMENAYKLAMLIEIGNIPYYIVENMAEGFVGELRIDNTYTDVENLDEFIDKLRAFKLEMLKGVKIKTLIVTPATMKFVLKMFDRMYLPHGLKVAESLIVGSDNGGGDNNKGDVAAIKSIMKEHTTMSRKELLTAFGGTIKHLDTAIETLRECCLIDSEGNDDKGRPTKNTVYHYYKKVENLTLPERNYAEYCGTSYQAGIILERILPFEEMVKMCNGIFDGLETQKNVEEFCLLEQ